MLAYGIDVQTPPPYGVAIEAALEDLEAASLMGRDLLEAIEAAERAGCTSREIALALGEAHATA